MADLGVQHPSYLFDDVVGGGAGRFIDDKKSAGEVWIILHPWLVVIPFWSGGARSGPRHSRAESSSLSISEMIVCRTSSKSPLSETPAAFL